jgi:GLPGLI family protein
MLSILFNLSVQSMAQTLEAQYTVTRQYDMQIAGNKTKPVNIEFIGHFYRSKNHYIYFDTPNFLKIYPDGVIKVDNYSMSVSADSIQSLSYHDLDSAVRIYRRDMPGKGKVNFNIKDRIGRIKWKIDYLDETKEINGLLCQKANLSISGYPQWVVWFAPSIPMDVGIVNIRELPGLVVEAEMIPTRTKYVLQKYVINGVIDEKVFHPVEFKQRFEDPYGVHLDEKSDKINKQLKLLNGN